MIRSKKSFCQSQRRYTTVKVAGEFVAIIGRLLRSFIFNILMFVLGFGCGFAFIASRVHYYATKNTDIQYIQQLEEQMNEFLVLDDKYTHTQNEVQKIIKNMKIQMSHNIHPECKTAVGKIIIKKDN